MEYINNLKSKINGNLKRIVLPEANDERVLKAAEIIKKENLADIILVGDNYLNPSNYEDIDKLIEKFIEIRKDKTDYESARELILNNYVYFSIMLVICGEADGVVAGATHSTADTLRPALQLLKKEEKASSFFIVDTPKSELGHNGTFIFADCGLIQDPSSEELSIIAKESYDSYKELIGDDPRVAMLSHSTMGSAKGELVDKVKKATEIIKERYPEIDIVGEVQTDAALNSEIARIKGIDSGNANILIFPNIDAGNIGYKLVQILGDAKCYGPVVQGLSAPVNDLSRGCSVDDIVSLIIITAFEAQNKTA